MNSSVLVIEDQTEVLRLTLNRPDKRNALNLELMNELAETIEKCATLPQVRVVVIRGAGNAFCAGLDLSVAQDPSKADDCAQAVVRMLRSVFEARPVTIAEVHGYAVAGGAGLMSACDLVVASQDTRIGYPEVKRGLVAASVMALLRRQVRERDARELLILGELINAERAYRIGLINQVVPGDRLSSTTEEWVRFILEGAPGAIARTKELLNQLWPCSLDKDFDRTLQAYLSARESDEAREGIQAFLEKRPSRWQRK